MSVASQRRRIGADEHEPEALAELRNVRRLRHRPRPAPHRVGARGAQRALQAGRAETDAHRLIGLADEQRVALGLGVQSDQVDGICPTVVELAHGMDDAHRRLTAARDRQP